ncbi:MAG: methyl-accepting chemotaxis protein [Lachnospiraceae bacterium]|nr:methyl-accepting chemotaxis protein [Lachnospiraceae bacterium]
MKTKDKVPVMHSIKTKMNLLVFISIVSVVTIVLRIIIPQVEENMRSTTQSYMKDIALVAGASVDREMEILGSEVALAPEELDVLVGDVTIKGMSSSYAYVVSADGTMLYHPTPEKIGQPVENAAVTALVSDIAKGNIPQPDLIEYLFKGVMKYAAYYIGEDAAYILVITADESEVFADMKTIISSSIIGAVITAIIYVTLALFISVLIIKPIQHTTDLVKKIAGLDFRKNEKQAKIMKRKDESGAMARAVEDLRETLVAVIAKIMSQSSELYTTANSLNENAEKANDAVKQVEKAIDEIAEGASSQAADTQTATENVIVMGNMIEETSGEVERLRENARAMRDAGETAVEKLSELSLVNQKTKDAIQVIYEQTNITNDSVNEIEKAVNIITDIAEETNLLSLNASIEAARAGEQGRGFAVVAAQIQKLAEQSNESASQIKKVIETLMQESHKSVETMEEVKEVVEKQDENVQRTSDAFMDVKQGIDTSIDGIRVIASKTQQLDEARVKVVDVVQNLTAIAEENAASTEETSALAVEVSSIMNAVAERTDGLYGIARELEDGVKEFTIE